MLKCNVDILKVIQVSHWQAVSLQNYIIMCSECYIYVKRTVDDNIVCDNIEIKLNLTL